MKKFLLVLGNLFLAANFGFAADCSYCVEPYGLSSGASRFMSTVTGANFLGKQVAKAILKKEISKNIDGKLKIKVVSYSVKDLKKGIFKSISISGKNVDIEGVKFTALDMNTLCDFNYILMTDPPVFREDFPLAFSSVMSADDINHNMTTNGYKRVIDDLNTAGGRLGLFRIMYSQVKIKDNRFYYILTAAVPFARSSYNIVLTSDLKVSEGHIDFENTKLINDKLAIDSKMIDYVINYVNPLDFSLKILQNKHAKLTVNDVKFLDNKIYADGTIVIPKD